MKAMKLGQIIVGQDGAVLNGYLFRFDIYGNCVVYRVDSLSQDPTPISQFTLDKADIIMPHSNAVVFGNARYCQTDEFPLLYSNIYNTYAKSDNRMEGVTCVYRLQRSGNRFWTTLVQTIEIGFVKDPLWRSENRDDVRPYGNFAIDAQKEIYYAFTLRDEDQCTRYFSFQLPDVNSGEYNAVYGAKRVILQKEDILDTFDCEYQRYIQGAAFRGGIIYSLEGFTDDQENPPAIRLIDVAEKRQKDVFYFSKLGLTIEPELIDFEGDTCYYADHEGNVFELIF